MRLRWASAAKLPKVIVAAAMIATRPTQPGPIVATWPLAPMPADHGPTAWSRTFMSATTLAIFEPVAIQAVTGAGAPSYASGAHWWKGKAATLKPNPTRIRSIAVAPATFPERPMLPAPPPYRATSIAENRVLPAMP